MDHIPDYFKDELDSLLKKIRMLNNHGIGNNKSISMPKPFFDYIINHLNMLIKDKDYQNSFQGDRVFVRNIHELFTGRYLKELEMLYDFMIITS